MQEIFFVFEHLPLWLGDKATLPSQLGRNASVQVGVIAANAAVLFFFLPSWQIMKYSEQRIPTLNEYCVVCDEQHVFQNGSMLKVGFNGSLSLCSWQGRQITCTWCPGAVGRNIIKNALKSTNRKASHTLFFNKVCVLKKNCFWMLALCDVTICVKRLTCSCSRLMGAKWPRGYKESRMEYIHLKIHFFSKCTCMKLWQN